MSAPPAVTASAVTGADLLLWVAIPYICLAVFVVGHVWRYRQDQFGWTSRTSQLLEHRWLRWGSPLFHLGAFAVIAGHVVGEARRIASGRGRRANRPRSGGLSAAPLSGVPAGHGAAFVQGCGVTLGRVVQLSGA